MGMATTLGSQALGLVAQATRLARLGGAFGPIARRHLRDPFLLHWVDLLCFLISGLPMDQTSAAAMAYRRKRVRCTRRMNATVARPTIDVVASISPA